MKKSIFLLAFLLSMLWHVSAVAEKCDWKTGFCFGVNWKTATLADVQGIDVRAKNEVGGTPLHFAAEWNENPDIINALIQVGADIHAKTNGGKTPLHSAAEHNENPDIINALIQAGVDIDAKDILLGKTPLHSAASSNENPDIINVLIQAGADIHAKDTFLLLGNTPLHYAASSNENPDIINALIQAGADIDAKSNNGNTPLHSAVIFNEKFLDIIAALIVLGADTQATNNNGETAEDVARSRNIYTYQYGVKNALKVASEILKNLGGVNWQTAVVADVAKADLSARLPITGETVLHSAAQYSTPEVVAALIAKRVGSRDKNGATALHAAVKSGNVDALAILIDKININAQDKNGNTPLHYAVIANQQQAVLWLIKNGADATIFNTRFKRPIALADENTDFKNSEAYWALNDASYAGAN